MKWITRVPAPLSEAQAAGAQANPATMPPLMEGYRYQEVASSYGEVEQRWLLIHSEPRQPQAKRLVANQLRKQSEQEVKAFTKLCGSAFACEADATQALVTCEQALQATFLETSRVYSTPRYGTRGRPGQGSQPAHVVYPIEGALASRLATRQALVDQHSCCILATNELDATVLPPKELPEGYKGQSHAERGFRCLKDPQFFTAAFYLKKPERIMAPLMVMTVCLLG